ncbi:hypothetical protein GJ699_28125 [Duganella sp. FT80W]|uniref:Uncharacterized protein n=1 Tax=Duganella guangzhouensis TaxID=2666084 RepID=A0A6I2L6G6_9BURK|nr:hypothetical protein [Duganella guangzhouensis]MRW93865.1 hypothetical protein [Duganella guangzhouensis]
MFANEKMYGFLRLFTLSLVVTLVANVLVLNYLPGYGLIFVMFCFIGGLGMLPWFHSLKGTTFSAGVCLGVIFATMFFFRETLFS